MKKILTGALAALTLGGVVLGGATEASARERDHRGGGDGAAIVAGIAGLAIGAALASDRPHYAPAAGYYDAPPRGYYEGSAPAYYEGPAYYSYENHCRVEWRWNRHWGHYERARACY